MAVKPFRVSVNATQIQQAWAPITSSNIVELTGGVLGVEIGTAVVNPVLALMNGTAAAAGTLAYIPLGGSVTAAGQSPAAVPFDFGKQPLQVDGAGGLGVKFINTAVGAATVSGYFHGREQRRT